MGNFKKLSVGLWLVLASSLVFAEDVQVQPIGPFGTLNNFDNPITLDSGKAQDLLNIDIDPGGRSVKKRKGYGEAFALNVTTSATHGSYIFFDTSGNEVILVFNDREMSSSINGAQFDVLFRDGPDGATYDCVDSVGLAYCLDTSRTQIIRTDGATFTTLNNVNSTGTMVALTPDRLVMAGFAPGDGPSRIDFSKSADFTTWLPPFSAGSDPNQITVTAPGAAVQHIAYAFNRIMWFKNSSFGYVLFGPELADWQVRTVSPLVGTLDNTSVYWNEVLYWRAQDGHFYSYDGANIVKMSRDITESTSQAQNRISNSWVQTTQADFENGVSTPTGFATTSISPGNVILTTAAAISAFVDTDADDFALGTLTNVSTSTLDGSLTLEQTVTQLNNYEEGAGENTPRLGQVAQSFVAAGDEQITGVQLFGRRTGSPGTGTVFLKSDSSDTPGTTIASVSFDFDTVGTSNEWIVATFDDTVSISSTTQYWVGTSQFGSGSNQITLLDCFRDTGCTNTGETFCLGVICVDDETLQHRIDGAQYDASGNIVSQIFDTTVTTATWLWDWDAFDVSSETFTDTTLTYETQTSSSSTGVFESLISVLNGSNPTSTVQEFIRYKASFATTDLSTSPIISDVTINMSDRLQTYATFYSEVHNHDGVTSWNTFSADTENGTHTFEIRTDTNSFSLQSSTPTWTSVTSGDIPTISTGNYFQVRDMILSTAATATPTLKDFTVSWFEGTASDKMYGLYHDYALWWNVQLGTDTAYNNHVIKYDMLNNGFLLYDIPMNGMYERSGDLYFGSPSTGHIYKFGDTNDDNGSNINSYWESKDYASGFGPFTIDQYVRLSVLASSVEGSSVTLTYTVDGSSAASNTMNLYNSASNYKFKNLNLPLGKQGTTFSVKFGNNASDQPFEVFAIQYGYRERPWRSQE